MLPNQRRMQNLLEKARENSIAVEIIDTEIGKPWYGLYIRSPIGVAIAIKKGMSECMTVWVLAHELGHHFYESENLLFSPFRFPTVTNRHIDPVEEAANQKALNFLTNPEDWCEAELKHPTCLKNIVAVLDLPLAAGISWERLLRTNSNNIYAAQVEFTSKLWEEIKRRVAGRGGAQKTFKNLLMRRKRMETTLIRSDFSLIRARAATMRGGWGGTFRKIVRELEGPIRKSGGTGQFFSSRFS